MAHRNAHRPIGIPCLKCGHTIQRVYQTQKIPVGIRRIRICKKCGDRFATTERNIVDVDPPKRPA
jgi:transcriptional regulator NrdR family protein